MNDRIRDPFLKYRMTELVITHDLVLGPSYLAFHLHRISVGEERKSVLKTAKV